jgi:PAS domain S-box-containing protein
MTEQEAPLAVISLDTAWRYVDASPAALELLGVTLAELRSSERDRFALHAADDAEQAAMRARWEAGGAQPMAGTTGLRRADGAEIRVSYTLERIEGGFRVWIWQIDGAPDAPTTVLSVGDVLREWRAAERALAGLRPGSPELALMLNEIGLLRSQYQRLFRAAEPPTDR